jgi:hypothetical protein
VFEIINEKDLSAPSSNTPAPVTNAAPAVAPK